MQPSQVRHRAASLGVGPLSRHAAQVLEPQRRAVGRCRLGKQRPGRADCTRKAVEEAGGIGIDLPPPVQRHTRLGHAGMILGQPHALEDRRPGALALRPFGKSRHAEHAVRGRIAGTRRQLLDRPSPHVDVVIVENGACDNIDLAGGDRGHTGHAPIVSPRAP